MESNIYQYGKWQLVGTYRNIHHPPPIPGVYVIYLIDANNPDTNKILYIGRSNNIAKRFTCHRIYNKIIHDKSISLFWLNIKIKHTRENKELEKSLIMRLKPKYNKTFNWNYNG